MDSSTSYGCLPYKYGAVAGVREVSTGLPPTQGLAPDG